MSKDCTIQDVFHRFYSSFESTHSISPAQRKAAYHIMNCKTGAFGVNVSVWRTAAAYQSTITPAVTGAVLCVRSFQKKNG